MPDALGLLRNISWRAWRVWHRDLLVYRATWWTNLLPPMLEPILYFFAFGAGVGMLVGRVLWEGREVSYLEFVAPGLVSVSVMFSAVFETSYGSFVRMYYQKTFDAILATPLSLEDVLVGEILWGATKSVLSAAVMAAVIAAFGLLVWPSSLWLLPLSAVGGLLFASLGLCFTAVCPTIDAFNLPTFLLIMPMFLFSGTFFPLEVLPGWAQVVGWGLPLTHLASLLRASTLGVAAPVLLPSLAYLAAVNAVLFVLALALMRRRLVR